MESKMNLTEAKEGATYKVKRISTSESELDSFLFTLGCYEGEPITVISHLRHGEIVSIKNGRYSIDTALARAIEI